MIPFPQTLEALLERPFLTSHDWERFSERLVEILPLIREEETILCVEEDSVEALAVFFAGVLKKGAVFFGNSRWQKAEWEQVNQVSGFHRIFGPAGLDVDSSRTSVFRDARIMIPSGGTSGKIRFCVHTLNTLSAAVGSLFQFHGRKPLNSVSPLPVFHVSGLMPVLRACLTGGMVHLAHWKAIEAGAFPSLPGNPSSISLVPTQLARLVRIRGGLQFLHGFDSIYIGGGKTPPGLVNTIRGEKLPVLFVYGMTETAAMVVAGTRASTDGAGNIWGRALPGVSTHLSSDQEISIKTKSLFHGYYPEDSELNEYLTGDIGRWVTGELLQIMGRKDLLINFGGEKINPEEIESVLSDCLGRADLAVSSIPDEEWGELLVAVFETELPSDEIEMLKSTLATTLAPHKIPKRFITGTAIPRSAFGKVNRAELRRCLVED